MTEPAQRLVLITGCSGGGKSTLLAELGRRGFAVVQEPGRRIVAQQLATGGSALPWIDLEGFLRRAIDMAQADYDEARAKPGVSFFDRGLVDAASALEELTGEPAVARHCTARRYAEAVFLTPPWPEIYQTDAARRHDIAAAVAEHDRLAALYPVLGYMPVSLPKLSVADRAEFVLNALALPKPPPDHKRLGPSDS